MESDMTAFLDGLRYLDQMVRPVGGGRRRATDCATFESVGSDLRIDSPGGSTLIPVEGGALEDHVSIRVSGVEGIKRGFGGLTGKNPLLVLSVQNGEFVVECDALRARYALQERP
jgi:hypothetical protein